MKLSSAFLRTWADPWREYLSEFIGTALFVFLASAVVIVGKIYGESNLLVTSFGVGFSYMAMLYATSHISSGFLNPAAVVSLWLVKRLSGVKTVFYIMAQILGSFAAVVLIFAAFGQRARELSFGAPVLGLGVSVEAAFTLEAILVSIFVLLVFVLIAGKNAQSFMAPLALGVYLVVASFIAYPISGISANPARALGPVIIAGDYGGLVVYLVAPFLGSLIGLFCEYVLLKKVKSQTAY